MQGLSALALISMPIYLVGMAILSVQPGGLERWEYVALLIIPVAIFFWWMMFGGKNN